MAFCKNCGKEINDNQSVCLSCGVSVGSTDSNVVDNGGVGWGLLGFCIPVVGLVLFLIWKDQKPNTAKAAGIGALISVGIYVLFYVVFFIAMASSF